jgi:prolipoprotein diacylglyceryltransferase
MLLGVVSVCYAPARFLLDYLRAGDIRYGGWTLGQYFSALLLCFGLWVLATMQNGSDRQMTPYPLNSVSRERRRLWRRIPAKLFEQTYTREGREHE